MFSYEIVEHIGTFSEREYWNNDGTRGGLATLELNRISYNGRKPKYDLRRWIKPEGDAPIFDKGLTLTDEEIAELKDTLDFLAYIRDKIANLDTTNHDDTDEEEDIQTSYSYSASGTIFPTTTGTDRNDIPGDATSY